LMPVMMKLYSTSLPATLWRRYLPVHDSGTRTTNQSDYTVAVQYHKFNIEIMHFYGYLQSPIQKRPVIQHKANKLFRIQKNHCSLPFWKYGECVIDMCQTKHIRVGRTSMRVRILIIIGIRQLSTKLGSNDGPGKQNNRAVSV
jgi:hypothetical protein